MNLKLQEAPYLLPLVIMFVIKFLIMCTQGTVCNWGTCTTTKENASSLERNMSIQEIVNYYNELYLRLSSKDYGFAQFGENCKIFSPVEIKTHLDMERNMLRDQEEDGKYQRAVEEHLHPTLQNFYARSKTICDFFKLLVCDPVSKICVCADESMEIGRNGTCQIIIEKRCDLNASDLVRMGIPSLRGHPIHISCIEEGECVSGFGNSSKLCQCKKGFFGTRCKPIWDREDTLTATTGQRGDRSSLGHQIGRGFEQSRGKSTGHLGNGSFSGMEEYFLYPEEIKAELIKLMGVTQANLTLDIHQRFSLNLGETCSPETHFTLLDPKNNKVHNHSLRIASLFSIVSAKPDIHFCNLDKLLICSEVTKRCECFHHLVDEDGACHSPNLHPCDTAFPFEFKLYPNGPMLWRIEEIFNKSFQPQCVTNATCGNNQIVGKCVCKNGKAGPLCSDPKSMFASSLNPSNVKEYNKDGNINEMFHDLNLLTYKMEQLMTLNYGDDCKPESASNLERINDFYRRVGSSEVNVARGQTLQEYKEVLKLVEDLIKSGVPKLCNQFNNQHCHPTTKKCSCPSGYTYQNKICRLLPGQPCDPRPLASWIPRCQNNSHCPFSSLSGSSQCQPTSRRAVDLSGQEMEHCNGTNMTECLDLVLNNTNTTAEQNNDVDLTTPTVTNSENFEDISLMLDRIMNDRVLPLDSGCDPEIESILTALFPSLPHFKTKHYNSLTQRKMLSYDELRLIDAQETKFCDRKRYLICQPETKKCDCNLKVYVREEGSTECSLREGSFCGEIGTVIDRSLNHLPKCRRGTKCSKFGYGVPTCRPTADEDF